MNRDEEEAYCPDSHYWLNWCEVCGWGREEEHVYYPERNPSERLHVRTEMLPKSVARGLERLRVALFWREGPSVPKNPLGEKENA